MDGYFWLLFASIFFAIISGLMNIFCVIRLRSRLFDLESMVIWKWSEAPWWTRIEKDEEFHSHLANRVRTFEGQRCTRLDRASQSGRILNENEACDPGPGSHLI